MSFSSFAANHPPQPCTTEQQFQTLSLHTTPASNKSPTQTPVAQTRIPSKHTIVTTDHAHLPWVHQLKHFLTMSTHSSVSCTSTSPCSVCRAANWTEGPPAPPNTAATPSVASKDTQKKDDKKKKRNSREFTGGTGTALGIMLGSNVMIKGPDGKFRGATRSKNP